MQETEVVGVRRKRSEIEVIDLDTSNHDQEEGRIDQWLEEQHSLGDWGEEIL